MNLKLTLPLALLAAFSGQAATLCGTIAAPLACTVTTSNHVNVTFGNFQLIASQSTGGAPTLTPADYSISANGVGAEGILTFTRTTGGPVVFNANAGQTVTGSISFSVILAPELPGTVNFLSTYSISLTGSQFRDGQAQIALIEPGAPNCQLAFPNTSTTCQTGSIVVNQFSGGMLMALAGNSGNAGIGQFSAAFAVDFTADPPPGNNVPEPSTWALIATGAGLLGWRKLRTQQVLLGALFGLALLAPLPASANTLCGTVAAPLACSETLANNVVITYTNFQLVSASSTGGAPVIQAADIAIETLSSGFSSSISFSRDPHDGFLTFFAGAGQSVSATLTFDVLLSTAVPGFASFDLPHLARLQGTASAGGDFSVDFFHSGSPACSVNKAVQFVFCGMASGITNQLPGNGLILALNSTNASTSVLNFSETFTTQFTADPDSSVPEPSTTALFLTGTALLTWKVRRR